MAMIKANNGECRIHYVKFVSGDVDDPRYESLDWKKEKRKKRCKKKNEKNEYARPRNYLHARKQ